MNRRHFGPTRGRSPAEPRKAPALLAVQKAIEALSAGRWEEAERQARSALELRMQDPGALHVLGCVALNQHRPDDAIRFFERVRATQSKDPLLHFNLGEAHRRAGTLPAALRHFRRASRLRPEFAEAHAQVAETLRALGHSAEAAQAYRTALSLNPDLPHCSSGLGLLLIRDGDFRQAAVFFEAALRATPAHMAEARAGLWANLGSAWIDACETPKGLAALAEAIACSPREAKFWRLLAQNLRHVNTVPDGIRFRSALLALFRRDDIDPRALATAAVLVLKRDPDVEALCACLANDPFRANGILAQSGAVIEALLCDELFLALLSATPIPDLGFEILLTHLRRDMLINAGEVPEQEFGRNFTFVCALARQCFLNEYVYWVDDREEAALAALRARLEDGAFNGGLEEWNRVVILACYVALHRTAATHLNFDAAPPPLLALIRQQIKEPAEEDALKAGLTALKPVRDAVSLAVQAQYEENPYPRWTRHQIGTPRSLREAVSQALPHLRADTLPDTDRPRILVAGCGTGAQTMKVLQTYAKPSVLAVDLSRSSLAYGMRKLMEYAVDSVRHLQADILDLADFDQRFDLIECFGVLHHMKDPQAGLRVLSGLLAPAGLMFLGLYSEVAREAVVAGRNLVAEHGLSATPSGVRAGRREIMAKAGRPELSMLVSPASDFWTLSECRDMIFHVEEHRFTLIEIGLMLESCGLEFLGLELIRPLDRARFAAEHQDLAALRSLKCWHEFESRHPDTFGDTYRIWTKRARGSHEVMR